jgi:hypothetical protein
VVGTLTAFGGVMAVVWSVVITIGAVGRFLNPDHWRSRGVHVVFGWASVLMLVAIPSLLWLLWDARPEPAYALCVMLASVSTIRLVVGLASVVFTIPMIAVRRFFRDAFSGIEGLGVERSDAFVADVAAGYKLTVAGNAEVERMLKRANTRPTWGLRVVTPLVIPLLVMYWLL